MYDSFLYEFCSIVNNEKTIVKTEKKTVLKLIHREPKLGSSVENRHKLCSPDLPKTLHLPEWVKLASCLDISVLLAQ